MELTKEEVQIIVQILSNVSIPVNQSTPVLVIIDKLIKAQGGPVKKVVKAQLPK